MDSLLKMTATISRATAGAADSWGQPGETWATVATTKCLVQHISAKEMMSFGESVVSSHKVWLPYGTSVMNRDRVVVSGDTYEVIWVEDNVGGQAHHAMAMLKLVETS